MREIATGDIRNGFVESPEKKSMSGSAMSIKSSA
jgi:hypothetical protein